MTTPLPINLPTPSFRTLVIGGNAGRWSAADPDTNQTLSNGVEAWVFALRGDYIGNAVPTSQTIAAYDLIIANLNPPSIPGLAALAEQRPDHVRWVSLIEGCGKDYLYPTPELRRVLDASDLVAALNERTLGYLRHLTKARTEWIGLPFPVQEVRTLVTPVEQRRDEILICPRRQFEPSILVANALGLPISTYLGIVSRKPKNLPLFLKHRYFESDLKLHLWKEQPSPIPRIPRSEKGLKETWQDAGGCRLWINLDPRYTWARWVIEAAILEVPIITTESTAHGPLLFPETTVRDEFCVDEAIAIGHRLLAEPEFASRVSQQALQHLSLFTPEACLQRLSEALGLDLTAKLADTELLSGVPIPETGVYVPPRSQTNIFSIRGTERVTNPSGEST